MTATAPEAALTIDHLIAFTVPEAMALLRCGRTTIYELIHSGQLKSFTQGRSRRVRATAIAEYLNTRDQEAG